jgi:hypothetical protein
MAKNAHFSLDSIVRGAQAGAVELAINTRIVAIEATAGFAKHARITKISIKAITIR